MKLPEYTKEEVYKLEHNSTDDTEVDLDRLPFWTRIKWVLFGPPGSTGPR